MMKAELPVWDTINASWAKTYGSKATFWAGIGILAVIMFSLGILEGITSKSVGFSGLIQIISNILGYFMQLGLIYIGITRAKDLPINYKMMFFTFDLQLALYLIGLYILQALIFMIPVLICAAGVFIYMMGNTFATLLGILLIIASIIVTLVLAVRLSLTMAFVLDAASAPVAAIKKSLAATDGNFWNVAGVFLLQMIIFIVSIIPLGLGLIWSIPFSLITYGMVYKTLRNNV